MSEVRSWPETLGALVARVREEQGISQLCLAQRLCAASGHATVTRHEVSRWERGERIPTPYWRSWLAEVLGVALPEVEAAARVARRTRARRDQVPGTWVRLGAGVYGRAS